MAIVALLCKGLQAECACGARMRVQNLRIESSSSGEGPGTQFTEWSGWTHQNMFLRVGVLGFGFDFGPYRGAILEGTQDLRARKQGLRGGSQNRGSLRYILAFQKNLRIRLHGLVGITSACGAIKL